MELKQFVTAALTEILDGVKDSQREIEHAREGEVNPQLATNQGALQNQGRLVSRWGQLIQTVKFDVAVTVEEGNWYKRWDWYFYRSSRAWLSGRIKNISSICNQNPI